jgi:hypothetical protein
VYNCKLLHLFRREWDLKIEFRGEAKRLKFFKWEIYSGFCWEFMRGKGEMESDEVVKKIDVGGISLKLGRGLDEVLMIWRFDAEVGDARTELVMKSTSSSHQLQSPHIRPLQSPTIIASHSLHHLHFTLHFNDRALMRKHFQAQKKVKAADGD